MIKKCRYCPKMFTIQPRYSAHQIWFVCDACTQKYATKVEVHVKVSGISQFLSLRKSATSTSDNVVQKKVLAPRHRPRSK